MQLYCIMSGVGTICQVAIDVRKAESWCWAGLSGAMLDSALPGEIQANGMQTFQSATHCFTTGDPRNLHEQTFGVQLPCFCEFAE